MEDNVAASTEPELPTNLRGLVLVSGYKIRTQREKRGWSKVTCARKLKISREQLATIESHDPKAIQIGTCRKIVSAFECDITAVLSDAVSEVKVVRQDVNPTVLNRRREKTGLTVTRYARGLYVSDIEAFQPEAQEAIRAEGIMDQLGGIYLVQHKDSHIDYSRCGFIVTARSLLDSDDGGGGTMDLVHYRAEFKTLERPVYCRCLSVTPGRNRVPPKITSCTLFHLQSDKQIETELVPIKSRTLENTCDWQAFFQPVLPPRSGPYRLDCQYLVDELLYGLKDNGRDELTFALRRRPKRKVRVDLVPLSSGKVFQGQDGAPPHSPSWTSDVQTRT